MNAHTKKMQKAWLENSLTYRNPIGMTGRRPVQAEFEATVSDLKHKFRMEEHSAGSILDVGCNNGYLLEKIAPPRAHKIGIDFCLEPLLFGKKMSDDIFFIQAEISELPFPDKSFDQVLCYNMYHYLPDPEAGLRAASELYRVLNSPGQLLIGDIFALEYKHLIPEEDIKNWQDPSRPFLHKFDNWMFMPIELLKKFFIDNGGEVEILPQANDVRCRGYRFDVLVRKREDKE